MMRVVAFRKAILAGVVGALAWEFAVALLIRAGLPLFEVSRLLGSMIAGRAEPPWLLWCAGVLTHGMVGAIWAIFYAYFFWSSLEWAPALQGLLFAAGPAALAGFVMVPQMGLMHPPDPGIFAWRLGWGGPAALLIGHAIYGLTMGAFYTRPVGRPVRRRIPAHG